MRDDRRESWLPSFIPAAVFLAILAGSRSEAAKPAFQPGEEIKKVLLEDLASRKSTEFEGILRNWQRRFGTRAVSPLLDLARSNDSHPDPTRYIALMGAVKLGGRPVAEFVVPFLKDDSWMIRTAALRSLAALQDGKTAASILPLLRDPSLIVRSEAVDAVEALRPEGAVDALVETLAHRPNYHRGKAQWVPQKALLALGRLRAKKAIPSLRPLLAISTDPELQLRAVETLETLTGRKLKPGAPLAARVKSWEKELSSR